MQIVGSCLAVVAFALVACTGGPGVEPTDGSPTTSDMSSLDLPDRSDLQVPSPSPGGSKMRDTLTGVFGADSIEGGCTYLEARDGSRHEVIYPDGWRIQASPLELTDPNGDVVATGGETITVRGAPADDMASICQIGPIFRATEVEAIEP